jgi:7-carboxy-7-deazaguanine synthase
LTYLKTDIPQKALPIMEAFYTIQGEGAYQGQAAYFIRIAGCDVGCVWCDVKDSWDADKHPILSLEEIVKTAAENPGRLAVVTGGEPLMYDLTSLCTVLKGNGFRRHIETSGAYPVSGEWDWICFSPKKFKEADTSIFPLAQELKVIIYNKSDFAFAEKYAALVNPECLLYIQPEWSKEDDMLPLMIDYVKNNPKWRISLQVHKYMNIP